MKNILIINDFVSKGKIAGNMMDPVLTYKNFNTYFIPSALISNNFSLGKVAILNTYDYMKETLRVYDELGFIFDMVFVGYVENQSQKDLIISYIEKLNPKPLIIMDPIMGDNGSLYKGVGDEKIKIYKEILEIADIALPNKTEAHFLGLDNYEDLLNSNKRYVITSNQDENGSYNLAIGENIEKIYYDKVNVSLTGTGDLFDALFIANYNQANNFTKAIEMTSAMITKVIRAQSSDHPSVNDIYIESYLGLLD